MTIAGTESPDPVLSQIFQYLDDHQEQQIALLENAVAIPSVSAWPRTHRLHSRKCAEFFAERLQSLGLIAELRELEPKQIVDGQEYELPPLVLGRLAEESSMKKTLLIYGHIDVQPAAKSDGWNSEPFVLEERDGKLYGRGSTDDKGPVLGWMNAIEAFQKTGAELPVNVRFLLEGMEESGSEGLEDCLRAMKKTEDPFLQGVDFCVISDSYWLGTKKPCVAYGLRGAVRFTINIRCANQDLHSGAAGSLVYEAMNDLVWLMSQLISVDGRILVPGIYEKVRGLTEEEAKTYESIDYDVQGRKADIGAAKFVYDEDPMKQLQGIWRNPWLSLHGIEGAFSDTGFKTVIPGRVIGKFSIRTVPDMTPQDTIDKVIKYLNDLWKQRGSPNDVVFDSPDAGEWYYADPNSTNYLAARKAVKLVFGVEPDLIREGGSIPITGVIHECTGKDVCLLPIGCSNDGAHSQNEKIDRFNYISGAKLMAAYFQKLAVAV